ncbi:MAG TPA: ABC transporter permease subunit [Candidatus Saccharimonadales bacterium]|nr:ABC transporter permease subunit [Candidatus Saccharimonadales bacterium]
MSHANTSPTKALVLFGIKQTLKGGLILGFLVGLLVSVQGLGYAASYPDQKSRDQFAASLASAPGLGILYGEAKNMATPASYTVYRAVAVVGLIAAVWGLMTSTRLLRGQEEDGHWETITSGNTTPRKASLAILAGYSVSIFIAFLITTVMTAAMGLSPDVSLTLGTSALIALAIFLPALLFTAVGLLVSQLSFSRRRALLYGLVPLLALFTIRSIANTVSDLYFLKQLTPFGWTDMISPVIDPQLQWILPFAIFIPVIAFIGAYLVGKRDLGEALLPERTTVKSHFFLLKNPFQLTIRQNASSYLFWAIGIVLMSIIIATVTNVASDAVADSPALTKSVTQLGGSPEDLKIAFIGAGMIFVVIALLIMAAVSLASVRKDEAKNYLDNLLVQPIHRSSWLIMRLIIIAVAFVGSMLLSTFVTWLVAHGQGISIDLGTFLLVSLALVGPVVFTLGIGTLLYGLWPRLAAVGMYIVLGWSFLVDLIGSVITLNDFVVNTSLFHYMSLSPATLPDWMTFSWLTGLGLLMMAIGIIAFTKRDITAE